MSDPITWGNANITWTRERGYTLHVPLWADERMLALRESEALKAVWKALDNRGSNPVVSFFPMVLREDASGSTAEEGEIVISTDSMLTDSEAADLREGLTQAFHGVREDAEKAIADDERAAATVLSILKQG